MNTKSCAAGIFAIALSNAVALSAANAQSDLVYPNKAVRFVVPFPAGTAPDIIARVLGDHLSKSLAQPVLVENRPGAAGIIGAEHVAKSPADGYTLFMAVNSILTINPHVYSKISYNALEDFTGVTQLTLASYALIANPSFGAKSVAEFVQLAKERPGQIPYASPGVGSAPHVIMEQLSATLGIKLNHIPFKTSGLNEVIGNQIPISFEPIATAVPAIQGGKVKVLAVTSPKRLPVLADAPAIAESIPGFDGDGWHGVMVHSKTPRPIVTKLHAELTRILRTPEVHQRLTDLGLVVVGNAPEAFDRVVRNDYDRWGRVVKAAAIKLD